MDVEKGGGHSRTSTLTIYISRNRAAAVLSTTPAHAVALSTMETNNQTKMCTFALGDKAMYTGQDRPAKCGSKQRSDKTAVLHLRRVYCQFHKLTNYRYCTPVKERIVIIGIRLAHGGR